MSAETDLKVLRSFVERRPAANDRYRTDGTSLYFGSTVPGSPTPTTGGREVARWSDHCRFHGLDGPEHARICPLANQKIILRRINNVAAMSYRPPITDEVDPATGIPLEQLYARSGYLGKDDSGGQLRTPIIIHKPINNSVVLLCIPPPAGIVPPEIPVLVAQKVTPPRQREMEL